MAQQRPPVRPKRVVNKRKPAKKKIKSKSEKMFDLYLWIAGLGMLAGVLLTAIFFADALTSISTVFSFILVLGIVSILIGLPLALKKDEKGISHLKNVGAPFFIGISILGGGALLTGIAFTLNSVGKSSEPTVSIYKLGERDKKYRTGSYSGIVYHLENDAFQDQVDLRWFRVEDNYKIKTKGYVHYELYEGLLGIQIFGSRGAVSDSIGSDYIELSTLGDGF